MTPALVTVRVAVPCTVADLAVIVAVPGATPLASPVASIDATLVLEELHCAVAVRSFVVPSENRPVAVNG